jgi:hypothetical protein
MKEAIVIMRDIYHNNFLIELIEEREKTKKELLRKHPGESVEEEEQRIKR